MSYQRFFDSLSEHGKGILVAQKIDESIFEFVDPQDLQSLGMLLGDVLKAKKFLGVAKHPRELKVDDEENGASRLLSSRARTLAQHDPKFTSGEEAFDALSLLLKPPDPEWFELSTTVKRYNRAAITDGLICGVKALMAVFVQPVDQSRCPLMCVLGVSGQGKTDTLNFIRRDAGIQALVIEEINEHIKLMPRLSCKHVVALFATFSTFNREKEPTIESALCNRLLSHYAAVEFDPSQSTRFDNITLRHLTEFIRKREATERLCTPAEICVIVLVDEVLEVMNGAARDNMTTMLDAICSTQQAALCAKELTFAVVTSVTVDVMYARVTRMSERPLHSIPLSPCSVADIDDIVDKIVKSAENSGNHFEQCAAKARAELLWPAHATCGHFRSLEKLWLSFKKIGPTLTQPQIAPVPCTAACILHVMAKRLDNPLWLMKEAEPIGAVFSEQGAPMSLYEAAMSNEHGVFYEATDAEGNFVRPCVMPCALSARLPFCGDTPVAQSIVKLWRKMHSLLTSVKRDAVKGWEMGVPLLELVASTLMHEVNGKKRVAFCNVWRGAHLQPWADREAELFYRPMGSDCADVFKRGAREPTEAADDEALQKVCSSSEPTLCQAETSNYPSIEGVHTLLEADLPCGTRSVIPVLIQMKARKDVCGQNLIDWAEAAHARGRLRLGVTKGLYFVALYVSNTPKVENWKLRMPEGTIVIEREALAQFLSPFGMTPLLHMLDTHND